MEAIHRFLGRVGAAILGAILAMLAEVMKLPVRAILLAMFAVTVPFAVLYLSVQTGITSYANFGALGVCLVTLGSLVMYSFLALGAVIMKAEEELGGSILIVLSAIFVAPFSGASKGWNDGLVATINSVGDLFSQHFVDVVDSYQRIWEHAAVLIPADDVDVDAPDAPQAADGEFTFKSMALLPSEVKVLKDVYIQQRPLTAVEIAKLKSDPTQIIKEKTRAYLDLQRLITEECPVSFERPERDSTILLVKQYYQPDEKKWLPVPKMAYIFDQSSLDDWVTRNPVNPLGSDPLERDATKKMNPDKFPDCYYFVHDGMSKVRYDTRYVFHNYYVDEHESKHHVVIDGERKEMGFCQEVNQLTTELRAHLSAPAAVENDENSNNLFRAQSPM